MKRVFTAAFGLLLAAACAALLIQAKKNEPPPPPPELDCPQGKYQVKDQCVDRPDLKPAAPAPLPTDTARP